jgi:hypothetical protein
MAKWNFVQQCGSDTPFEVLITDATTGDPVDLTGGSAEWIFARRDGQGNPTVPVLHYTSAADELTLGADGKITGSLLPADTEGIAVGIEKVIVLHQMFLALPGGEPMLVQDGEITFFAKLPTE